MFTFANNKYWYLHKERLYLKGCSHIVPPCAYSGPRCGSALGFMTLHSSSNITAGKRGMWDQVWHEGFTFTLFAICFRPIRCYYILHSGPLNITHKVKNLVGNVRVFLVTECTASSSVDRELHNQHQSSLKHREMKINVKWKLPDFLSLVYTR